jgi:hypothetical protein
MIQQHIAKGLATNYCTLSIASLLLVGCGTSARDTQAEIQRNRQQAQVRNARLESLRVNAEARLKAGETAPENTADPGHEVVRCQGIAPVPFTLQTPLAALSAVICGNSEQGQKVLAYRRWYCGQGDSTCVLSQWSDGQPTLREGFGQSTNVNFRVQTSSGIAAVSLSPY